MKLLIIGLDGCTDRVYWDREVLMPFVREVLIPRSMHGTSISEVQRNREGRYDPHTGPNWSSIYTGVPVKVHGVDYGGWVFDHKSHGSLKAKSVWYMIREKYNLGLMAMPITYPAFRCNWMISGFPNSTVTKYSVYPRHLYTGLKEKNFVVDYADGVSIWRDKLQKKWKRGEDESFMQIEFDKFEMAKKLYATDPVDVLAFGNTSIDKVCHIFGLFSKQAKYVYAKIDKLVQKMIEYFDPDNTIIVADHGFEAFSYRHNKNGFYLWNIKGSKRGVEEEIKIYETTKLILNALEMEHDEIGIEVDPEVFTQEEKEAIEYRYRQLGYLK